MALENGRARIEGASWSLWGRAGEGVSVGEPATAVIRVERLRLDGAAQDNSLQLPLLTSMYLGDRWEYLFRTEGDDFPLRAYGTAAARCRTLPSDAPGGGCVDFSAAVTLRSHGRQAPG